MEERRGREEGKRVGEERRSGTGSERGRRRGDALPRVAQQFSFGTLVQGERVDVT